MISALFSALLCPPAQAAPTLGTSWSQGTSVVLNSWYSSPFKLPTLDLRWDRFSLSFPVVDFLTSLSGDGGLEVGADFSVLWHEIPVSEGLAIIDRPGLAMTSAASYTNILVGYRAGIQLTGDNGAGFSLCLAPAFGPSILTSANDQPWGLAVASLVELSVWGRTRSRPADAPED